jgi:hypothetical protein
MANPQLPIQNGNNLPGFDRDRDVEGEIKENADIENYADMFDLDSDKVEQEIIEMENG